MNRWLIPFGSLSAIAIGVIAVLAVAGVFDNSSDAGPAAGDQAETAALCVEGVEDCDDMIATDTGDGDDIADGLPPSDATSGTCIEGTVDCNDTVSVDNPGEPVSGDGDDPDGKALAVEAAFRELEAISRVPALEADVTEVRAVDWPNACLGVVTPGVACAEVITSGYIVVLDTGVLAFEFHTDTNGNAVLAEPAE